MNRVIFAALVALCAVGTALVATQSNALEVTLTVLPLDRPFLHHASVTVLWNVTSGEFDPENDFISSWWEPFAATYLEFVNITGNTGSATFRLLNGRHGIFFRYYHGDMIVAQTASIHPEGSYPMQIHTMFVAGEPGSIKIMWTSNRTTGTEAVRYGSHAGSLRRVVMAQRNVTYTHAELNAKLGLPPVPIRTTQFDNLSSRALRCVWGTCYNDFTALELFVDPGVIHIAVITGLIPGKKYYFRCGEGNGYMSTTKSFFSRVGPSPTASVQMLYVADAGAGTMLGGYAGSASHNAVPIFANSTEGARHVWAAIRNDPRSAFDQASIMNGDISYARGWPWVWELFANQTEQIFTQAPVIATYGNHEFDYANNPFTLADGPDSGGEAGVVTARRFDFASVSQPWFKLSIGPITFIALSSEHSITEQTAWLLNVLPTVDRAVTPFLAVLLHRPMYLSNPWVTKIQSGMDDAYADMFVRFGVDVVLTGHSHYYERMCEISCGTCATWGYRDVWTRYHHTEYVNAESCSVVYQPNSNRTTLNECRLQCLQNSTNCTSVYLEHYNEEWQSGLCYLSTCPLQLGYRYGTTVWTLEKMAGMPPVYIMDGTAGGVPTNAWTPEMVITQFKDFFTFGYSRINVNGSVFAWTHYHINGSLIDSVEIPARNTGA